MLEFQVTESIRTKLETFLEHPSTEELIPLVNLLILYSFTAQGKSLDEVLTEASNEILREIQR